MKSLQVRKGDISLGPNRRAVAVYGTDKLLQDLRLWLLEQFGIGDTTPAWGSKLFEFIGSSSVDDLLKQSEIEGEITRVLSLYQAWQFERLQQSQYAGLTRNWSRSEILAEIVDISSQVSLDKLLVSVRIRTLSDNETILNLETNTSSIQFS